ncbi:hypothetical protein PFISCL1PPCAC_1304, partial [Pristionchus fissidentatus]
RSEEMRRACRVALQLRLCSNAAGPSRSIAEKSRSTVAVTLSPQDEKLIQRGEFYGVASTKKREQKTNSPEWALSRLHEFLHRNYRVSPEIVMVDLLLRLENEDEALISLLRRSPDRWIPMAIQCCGRALSTIQIENRRTIAKRMWSQIEKTNLPISIDSFNARLRVKMENDEKWNPSETLKEIEDERGLVPNQETFHLLLEKFAQTGNADQCNKLFYEMARRGLSPSDAIAQSHLVYASEVRGYNKKVDSMIEQSSSKFGPEGEALCLGAACVAAAAGGRIDRLRELLRRSVDDRLTLRIPIESVFEVIWKLSEKSADKETNHDVVIEEILSRCQHPPGFFKFLYREIERHISSSHFRTSIILLEETMRVGQALKNQERILFADQMVGRMCRAMVRSETDRETMKEIANRMEATLNLRSRFVHDELLMSALTLKKCDSDDRIDSLSSLIAYVDPTRERPHIVLPILAASSNLDDRLKVLYRSSSLGYSNLDELDGKLMAEYILQPLYKRSSYLARQRMRSTTLSTIEDCARILHSFGLVRPALWRILHSWWKQRKEEEREISIAMRVKPHSEEINTWLRSEYSSIFVDRARESPPVVPLTKKRLDAAIEKGDSSSILSLLSSYGWPEEVDLAEAAPRILNLLVKNESSVNIMKWLNALSTEAGYRQLEGGEQSTTSLKSNHLLRIVRQRADEKRMGVKAIIEMCYELKRLFPHAVANFDSFLNNVGETHKLFSYCVFGRQGSILSPEGIEEVLELLRTLIKLELIQLHANETITPTIVSRIIARCGWNSGVAVWLRLQSSLSLPNGIIVLLGHFDGQGDTKKAVKNHQQIQYVLHKAASSMTPSRLHSLHAAVMCHNSSHSTEETKEYFKQHGSKMSPYDCLLAYRLMHAHYRHKISMNFATEFPSLCLTHTSLGEKKEDEGRAMLSTALKYCGTKRQGNLYGIMYELFARFGIEADEEEKRKVDEMMEEHQKLIDRWIFSPSEGLLQVSSDAEYIKENEWKKYVMKSVQKGGEMRESAV